MSRSDCFPSARRVSGTLRRAVQRLALAAAVTRELFRRRRDDEHGLVVESDGPDAWAG